MAANGGGPPLVKKEEDDVEEEIDSNNKPLVGKNNNKGISIAERRAAKCGFNASSINATRFRTAGLTPLAQSPYFTVPPGLSPSALLDSPVMLPNAQAQLSPTTGTFQFPAASPPNHENLKPKLKLASNGDNAIAMESSSGAEALGVPLSESCPSNFRAETKAFEEFKYPREKVNKDCFEETGEGKSEVKCLKLQPSRNQQILLMISENDESGKGIGAQDKQQHQKSAASIPKEVTKCCEDGFYWRKYGQKHVKGSEYPRSYYKCTNTNCPVTKKVERSHDGQISEIVYKGSHNHPKPQQPLKRFNEMAGEGGGVSCLKVGGASDAVFTSSDCNGLSSFIVSDPLLRSRSATATARAIEIGQDQLNAASPESISNEDEGENGVCEPRKRKRDGDGESTRSAREPKVVVQIESDIDILDDGYRWRKYGQKVVKGNPNPRSYYKCTTPGCPVRKHVERAADDIKSVVTTYEGKHSHEVPSSRSTSSLMVPDVANSTASQKPDALKSGKQMPLYQLERNPVLNNNYNEFMRSNLPGDHLNFGASSAYPLSLPPFHSLPYLMNSNPMSSKLYPMIPDYLSMPSQMINPPLPGSSNAPLAGNFHYNNNSYAGVAEASSTGGQERGEEYSSHTKMVKPKEEQTDDQDELYDNDYCLSTPNHGNGTL